MKKYILLVLIFCSSQFVNAGAVNSNNTKALANILGDTTFMETVEAALEKKISETMSLKSVSWNMTMGGDSNGKVEHQFILNYNNMFFTNFFPLKECEILVTYTEFRNKTTSKKTFEINCQL